MRSVSIALFALLALGLPAAAAEGESGALRAALSAQELPAACIKDLDASQMLAPQEGGTAPEGFHSPMLVRVGAALTERGYAGGTPALFALQGESYESVRLFFLPEGGPVEIPRASGAPFPQTLSFGPFRMEGRPPMSLHLSAPTRIAFAQWKAGRKLLRALPTECLAGEIVLDGKTTRVAVLDRDLNGRVPDFCRKHARDGDLFLVDRDGDGLFCVSRTSKEWMGLTRFLTLAGRTWRASCEAGVLTLTPSPLPVLWLRFPNLGEGCVVNGWSASTGLFEETLDAEGCVGIPRDDTQLYSYRWSRDGWTLSGTFFGVGAVKPREAEGPQDLPFGPSLRASLQKKESAAGVTFTFKCLGAGNESVQAARSGAANVPVLVITDAQGREVFRQSMKPG
jgi:hypothetical protein